MTNVRNYTDNQILERVESHAEGFDGYPTDYWMVGVQSNEDETNSFDDKFYFFKGERCLMVLTGTTNAGKNCLEGYDRAGLSGACVWKTNMIYYGLYRPGKHKGRMDAWRQQKPIYYYRDKDKDGKAEQEGEMHKGIIGVNFHTNTYKKDDRSVRKLIGAWSYGCQVTNQHDRYNKVMNLTKDQENITYALLDEWEA